MIANIRMFIHENKQEFLLLACSKKQYYFKRVFGVLFSTEFTEGYL